MIYATCHIVNAILLFIFSYSFFLKTVNTPGLFIISFIAIIFEITQAIIPYRAKLILSHNIIAWLMWITFSGLIVLSIVFLPITDTQKIISASIYSLMLLTLLIGAFNNSRFYIYQMIAVVQFYASLLVLAS